MDDFAGHLRAATRVTLIFLSFCLAGWGLVPSARSVLAGLCIGVIVSLINGLYLAWKVNRIGQAALENTKKKVGVGFFSRACLAVLGVVAAQRYGFPIIAVVIGLFFFQLVTLLLGLISLRKKPD